MIKCPVRNLHSDKLIPPRVFDVIVDSENIDLEIKTDKNTFEKIPWKDVVYQVEAAKTANT